MNRADAIESVELTKNNECKSCVGINLSELKRKAYCFDSIDVRTSLIRDGQFLIKSMEMGYQINESKVVGEASKKLLDIIKQL